MLDGKCVVVTGGTGSLGQVLVRRVLSGELGHPGEVVVFSRDEAKQHEMRLAFAHRATATDDIVYEELHNRLRFRIGDVADPASMSAVLRGADVVCHAAALKQVPTCELQPFEAVRTNILGAENIVRAIRDLRLPVETVVAASTDKACKPVNVMGMTKAIQERIFAQANLECPGTRFVLARYGNVLASRGSVIPLFHTQIRAGGPVTVTTPAMTRFLLSLDAAVDTLFGALRDAKPGETYVPDVPSARVVDIAAALIGERQIDVVEIGVRPGEKTHEVLVSEEEIVRTVQRDGSYVIRPLIPALRQDALDAAVPEMNFGGASEYSSSRVTLGADGVAALLGEHGLMVEDEPVFT
jgi:FlaA1/EpsC-like NDP-sugar epimerase